MTGELHDVIDAQLNYFNTFGYFGDAWLCRITDWETEQTECERCLGAGDCICPDCDHSHDCLVCGGSGITEEEKEIEISELEITSNVFSIFTEE